MAGANGRGCTCNCERQRNPEIANLVNARCIFALAPCHRLNRRDQRRLPRRRCCRRQRNCRFQWPNPARPYPGVRVDRRRPAADVETVDGCAEQSHRTDCHEPAEHDPDDCPDNSKAGCFAQERQQHRGAAGAESANNTDLRPAPDHRNRDGVEDEECANHQRDVAQDAQIPAEGAQHAAILVGLAALASKLDARGKRGADALLPLFQRGMSRERSTGCGRRGRAMYSARCAVAISIRTRPPVSPESFRTPRTV